MFFGTPWVASETLAVLIANNVVPALVVTAPDAPVGRGLVLTPSETKKLALAHNIPVLTPEKLDAETIVTMSACECDYAIVVAYGKIFPSELIEIFPQGILNVHYSLLPKHRGAIPVEAAFLANDSETGVTIQTLVREVDAGDILAQESTPIAQDETARELRTRLVPMSAQLLVQTLPKYLSGEIVPIVQDASQASKEWRLNKEDGLLDLSAPAQENWNKYRAYADGIGTYFFENDKRMKITKASFKNDAFVIERVIPEGKNEMAYTG